MSDDGELILYKNQIEVQNVTGAGFEFELRDWNTNLLSMVYLSNMFNFAELCGSNELEDVGRNNYLARQVYTPAALLKTSRENAKKGPMDYKTFDNQYLFRYRSMPRKWRGLTSSLYQKTGRVNHRRVYVLFGGNQKGTGYLSML